jgi:hypothetical protein
MDPLFAEAFLGGGLDDRVEPPVGAADEEIGIVTSTCDPGEKAGSSAPSGSTSSNETILWASMALLATTSERRASSVMSSSVSRQFAFPKTLCK